MAVKIRLKRMGMKKKPFYRVIIADDRSPRDGRFVEEIGYYNPMTHPAEIKVDNDRAKYWLEQCAPDQVNKLRTTRNFEVYDALSEEEMAQIRALNQDKAFYDLRRGR